MDKQTVILTTEQAAKILGITRQGFAYLVGKGRIKPIENIKGKYKFFDKEEIYRYAGEKG